MNESKSFLWAFVIWFFLGGIGGHRVYIEEKFSILLWYWMVTVVTLGIFPIVDAFLIKGKLKEANRRNMKERVEYENSLKG